MKPIFFDNNNKINKNNNNRNTNNEKDHNNNEPDNNFAVEVIGLAGNLAVIGVMIMDRRTRLLMKILVMIIMASGNHPKLTAKEAQKCCVGKK